MRRRDVLRGAAGAAALPFASSAATATDRSSASAAAQESFEPIGSASIQGAREGVVGADGETAYVATGNGFATVDVSDPESPEVLFSASSLLSEHEHGPLGGIFDVKVDGDTLIVVGPANVAREDRARGVLVYDVSDPASPERTAFHETPYAIHNSYLEDGIAYLTALNAEHVLDQETPVRNPVVLLDVSGDTPEEVGRWSLADRDEGWLDVFYYPRSNHDIYVQDDVMYVAHWDAGTWLVDVSDPASPEYINHFGEYALEDLRELSRTEQQYEGTEKPGNSHYVAVNDDATLLASGAESWDVPQTEGIGAPGGIDLWDISDPRNPEKLSFIEGPPTPDPTRGGVWTTSHNFDFHGDRLYTSWYRGGVKIHDVSDPASPEQLAWWRQPEQAMFWGAEYLSEDAFVATSMQGGEDYPPGLYAFPNRAGEQADAPSLTASEQTTDGVTTTADETTATTATTTATTATTADGGDGGSGDGGDGGSGDGGESGGSVPGFGVLAAVSGASAAALAAWRRLG